MTFLNYDFAILLQRSMTGLSAIVQNSLRVFAEKWSWAKLRHTIGEPNRTRGIPGTHNSMYRLGNGQVIGLASGLEDQPVPGAILYQSFTPDYGFGAKVRELTAD